MKTDRSQDKYSEIFQELKEEKMNWDFEEFMVQAEEKQFKNHKISEKKSASLPKYYWLAASLVLIISVGYYMKLSDKTGIENQDLLVKEQIEKQRSDFNHENNLASHQVNDSVKVDSLQDLPSVSNDEEVMNKILPKRGRLKKQVRPQYVQNTEKKSAPSHVAQIPNYESNYVIINGQRIENEEEAIDVARYSLQILSDNVSKTVAHTDVLPSFTE